MAKRQGWENPLRQGLPPAMARETGNAQRSPFDVTITHSRAALVATSTVYDVIVEDAQLLEAQA